MMAVVVKRVNNGGVKPSTTDRVVEMYAGRQMFGRQLQQRVLFQQNFQAFALNSKHAVWVSGMRRDSTRTISSWISEVDKSAILQWMPPANVTSTYTCSEVNNWLHCALFQIINCQTSRWQHSDEHMCSSSSNSSSAFSSSSTWCVIEMVFCPNVAWQTSRQTSSPTMWWDRVHNWSSTLHFLATYLYLRTCSICRIGHK